MEKVVNSYLESETKKMPDLPRHVKFFSDVMVIHFTEMINSWGENGEVLQKLKETNENKHIDQRRMEDPSVMAEAMGRGIIPHEATFRKPIDMLVQDLWNGYFGKK